ncbi:MAG: hypothetical protein KDD58_06460 [Bdellovibrionales bacterium]|nr:hypothetical protein [Bdellovibrionales bacterium]
MKSLFVVFIFLMACSGPKDYRTEDVNLNQQSKDNDLSMKDHHLKLKIYWLAPLSGNVNVNNSLLVLVFNNNGFLVDIPENYYLEFYATMPEMGHPMESEGYFKRIDKGIYKNENIKFTMGGFWRMELWLMNLNNEAVEQVFWDTTW